MSFVPSPRNSEKLEFNLKPSGFESLKVIESAGLLGTARLPSTSHNELKAKSASGHKLSELSWSLQWFSLSNAIIDAVNS